MLAEGKDEILHSHGRADIGQQYGSAVRVVTGRQRHTEQRGKMRNVACVDRGLGCVVGCFIGRESKLQPINLGQHGGGNRVLISVHFQRKLRGQHQCEYDHDREPELAAAHHF